MLFTEIDNFIEAYNNSVIELVQCFGTSFFGRIDHLASSVIKFRPKNSVPKQSIRSITYKYALKRHLYNYVELFKYVAEVIELGYFMELILDIGNKLI